jgi:hypothetical protein
MKLLNCELHHCHQRVVDREARNLASGNLRGETWGRKDQTNQRSVPCIISVPRSIRGNVRRQSPHSTEPILPLPHSDKAQPFCD